MFSRLKITYEQYKEATKDIISDSYSYIEDKVIYAYTDNGELIEIKGIDLKGISKEEFKKHKQKCDELAKKLTNDLNLFDDDTITIKISGAYDVGFDSKDWKYVYSQQIREVNDEENTVYITNKRYTFEKQGKSWRIIRVNYDILVFSDRLLEKKGPF